MTLEEAEIALDTVDTLLIRALKIAEKAPYYTFIYNHEWARLDIDIDSDEAILSYFENNIEYDCPVIEEYKFKFPSSLLFLSDSELSKYQTKQTKIYEEAEAKKEEQSRKQIQKQIELNEREVLIRLKEKYEPNSTTGEEK